MREEAILYSSCIRLARQAKGNTQTGGPPTVESAGTVKWTGMGFLLLPEEGLIKEEEVEWPWKPYGAASNGTEVRLSGPEQFESV